MNIENQQTNPRGIGRAIGEWYAVECQKNGNPPSEEALAARIETMLRNGTDIPDENDQEAWFAFWREVDTGMSEATYDASSPAGRATSAFGNAVRGLIGMRKTESAAFPWSWDHEQTINARLLAGDAVGHAKFTIAYREKSGERIRSGQMAPALQRIYDGIAGGTVDSENLLPVLMEELQRQEIAYFGGAYTPQKREKLFELCQEETAQLLTRDQGDAFFLDNMLFALELVKLPPIRALHQKNFALHNSSLTSLPHFPLADIDHALGVARQRLAEGRHTQAAYIPDLGPTVERLQQWRDQVAAEGQR